MKFHLCLSLLLILCCLWPLSPSFAAPVIKASRILTGHSFFAGDGALVTLACFRSPFPAASLRAKAEAPAGDAAQAFLAGLLQGRELSVSALPATTRISILRVQVHDAEGRWIQEEMLKAGMGIFLPCRGLAPTLARRLLAAEDEARAARRGIWAQAIFAPVEALDAGKHLGKYKIVRGRCRAVEERYGDVVLLFGPEDRPSFTVLIAKRQIKTFGLTALLGMKGKQVEARGYLALLKRVPTLEAQEPLQLRVLDVR